LQTSAKRFGYALLFGGLVLAGSFLLAESAAAQDAANDDEALALATTNSTATTGCGTATNIGTSNVAPLYVDGFPCAKSYSSNNYPYSNQPYTNIKICAPNSTTNCQIIDHVIVDSGSDGVRMAASVLKSKLLSALPTVTSGSKSLTECEVYVDSFVYGPLKTVDLYIAGKVAKSVPIQVFGTGTATGFAVPSACSTQGGEETDTVTEFGGNGLIGVAFELVDTGLYLNCTAKSSACVENKSYAGIPNVVSKFATDNNGAVITLPAISTSGTTATVSGSLIFGVGTQANNTPPKGVVAIANDSGGEFNLKVPNSKISTAYIDSGTWDLVVNDSALAICSSSSAGAGFYCPPKNTAIALGISSYNKSAAAFSLSYTVGNATTLFNNNYGDDVAYNDITEPASSSSALTGDYAMGLSTFFGRSMYFVFTGKKSTLGSGPINAISPQK
jgi:hypothetical protein